MNKLTFLSLPAALLVMASCTPSRTNVTRQDAMGNYVTTSEYRAMERSEFQSAMQAGLDDFDARLAQLRKRANELGGDALREFSDWGEELEDKRVTFENELDKAEATLAEDWPEQRAATLEAYEDLRNCLDEAYDEVLEEA